MIHNAEGDDDDVNLENKNQIKNKWAWVCDDLLNLIHIIKIISTFTE
jgi:hypothetical protein